MSFFEDFCNKCLVKELKNEINTNVVLVTVNGFAYYGNLYRVKESRIAILTPGTGAVSEVRILRPDGTTFVSDFISIDLCTVTSKATGLATAPF